MIFSNASLASDVPAEFEPSDGCLQMMNVWRFERLHVLASTQVGDQTRRGAVSASKLDPGG